MATKRREYVACRLCGKSGPICPCEEAELTRKATLELNRQKWVDDGRKQGIPGPSNKRERYPA